MLNFTLIAREGWRLLVLRPWLASTVAIALVAAVPSVAAVGQTAQVQATSNASARATEAWMVRQRTAARVFIRTAAIAGGPIASHSDKRFVDPYLGNYAAAGLVRSCAVGDRRIAVAHLRWYASQSVRGPVQDQNVSAGRLEATGDFDSQDAYDGTFLSAYATAIATSRAVERRSHAALVPGVVAALARIFAAQDRDGLIWAKPNWHVKYLMDQVEVFWGLSDVAAHGQLSKSLRSRTLVARHRLLVGIRGLWNPRIGTYSYARHASGATVASQPSVAYPDSASQLWIIASGIASVDRSRSIVDRISRSLQVLSNPAATWVQGGHSERVGYWPLVVAAYERTGRVAQARVAQSKMAGVRVATKSAWPYNVGVAGMQLGAGDRIPSRRCAAVHS